MFRCSCVAGLPPQLGGFAFGIRTGLTWVRNRVMASLDVRPIFLSTASASHLSAGSTRARIVSDLRIGHRPYLPRCSTYGLQAQLQRAKDLRPAYRRRADARPA